MVDQARPDRRQVFAFPWERDRRASAVFVLDPRRYRRHRGLLLHADRVFLGPVWTPIVRVRARLPRAADGATEI